MCAQNQPSPMSQAAKPPAQTSALKLHAQAPVTTAPSAQSPSLLSNQSGQGVLEYVLILLVTVAIILGGLYQMNTAFKVWAQNYFGSYLSCLLETGELPALGGAFISDAGICNELYEPFSIENGRPLLASSGNKGSSSGGSSSSSGGSSNQSETAPSNKLDGNQGQRESTGSSSGSSQTNPSSRFSSSRSSSGSQRNPPTRRGSSDSYTGSTDGSIPMSMLGSGGSGRNRMLSADGSQQYSLAQQQERKPIKGGDTVRKVDEIQERAKRKATPFRAPAAKTDNQEDSGMTFGSFLRYLVIAAIIIALLLVVGGQLLQISKSSD